MEKKRFIPMVNCGLQAGNSPECWDGQEFETEQECEQWIDDNVENFTPAEAAGSVYPMEIATD